VYRAESATAVLHPGRAAFADVPDRLSAIVGELHPSLAEVLELGPGRVVVGEVAIRGLTLGSVPVVRVRPIGRYPAVERDLAVVVPETTPAVAVDETIRSAAGPLLVSSRLFDIYRGLPLGPGEKDPDRRGGRRGDGRHRGSPRRAPRGPAAGMTEVLLRGPEARCYPCAAPRAGVVVPCGHGWGFKETA
jgi:hypothetical protein